MNDKDWRDYMDGRMGYGGGGIWGSIGANERRAEAERARKPMNYSWPMPPRPPKTKKNAAPTITDPEVLAAMAKREAEAKQREQQVIDGWFSFVQRLPGWLYPVFFGLPCMGWMVWMAFAKHGLSWWLLAGAVFGYFLPLIIGTLFIVFFGPKVK